MRLRLYVLVLLLNFAVQAICASPSAEIDMEEAREWCDLHPLDRIEGIWEYPSDGVTVLIRRTTEKEYQYDIITLESTGLSVLPGERIGEVYTTADPTRFRLKLFTTRQKGEPGRPAECSATLTARDSGLTVATKKRTWSIHPLALLPHFWRLVRTTTTDPLKSLPVGMQKIYPSYDGNGSSRFHVRYL